MRLFLVLSLLVHFLKILLPWIMAFFLTSFFMGLAGIKGMYTIPVFLFGFVFTGLFLRDEVFPVIFGGKQGGLK